MTSRSAPVESTEASRRDFLRWGLVGGSLLAALNPSDALTAAETTAAAAVPSGDLGSLHPFIQGQAVARDFPLSFLNPRFRSVSAWRKRARARFLDLLHYAPPRCDPAAEVIERVDCGTYVREHIRFNTTPDLRVPAYVLVPKEGPKPAPAIVALHDHGGFYFWGREKIVEMPDEHAVLTDFKRQYYGGRSIATELVRQGYVVIIIDMFYWGERRLLLEGDADDWRQRSASITKERIQAFNARSGQNEQLVGRSIYSAGFTWPGVIFWDDLRTVDYLVTRPDVDPRRIGCVGLSVGGLRAGHLAALDERIRGAVAVGWMTSFPTQLHHQVRNTIGHTKVVPGLYREMDYPDVIAMAAPRPLLVINGSRDALFHPDGVRASFEKLQACWTKAGARERVRTRLYDTPHEFNGEMQSEAWAWLKRWV